MKLSSFWKRVARPGVRRASLAGALVAAAALIVAACGVGDQNCTTDSKEQDTDDACPYGPPGGPQLEFKPCSNPTNMPAECPTWDQVYAMLIRPDGGNCAGAACHGNGAANAGLAVSETDPVEAYTAITTYEDTENGKGVYLNLENPTLSWFVCNLRGDAQGGLPMPRYNGLTSNDDILLLEEWFACWASNTTLYGPGMGAGGGATTGAGGGGGAGGAGGGI